MTSTHYKKIALGLTLISSIASAEEMTLQDTKQLSLPASSLSELNIEAGSGSMTVIGDDSNEISVVAEIYQYEAHNNYCLSLKPMGDAAKLKAGQCEERDYRDREYQTRIDLTIHMPKSAMLDIADGSGEIKVTNVASADIKDGSGKIDVSYIAGKLTIHDGSGGIRVSNVENDISIHDGSGGIIVTDSKGDLEVFDGSGSIDVNNIAGRVTVSDGSGGIDIDGVDSFTLLQDGSGSVSVNNVSGEVNMGKSKKRHKHGH